MFYRRRWITEFSATSLVCLVAALMAVLYVPGGQCLKDVQLEIEPRIVQRGSHSKLTCRYDLEGALLYTVKWYRGIHEFYRYTPSEHPNTKTFPYTGVNVDLQTSNQHQVVLQKVGFNLSGNFSCEVTTEAPHLSTAVVSNQMLVVVLPISPPVIRTDKEFYVVGDILRANCTSPRSRPAVILTFMLNNIRVCEKCNTKTRNEQDMFSSHLVLDLPLFPSHFDGGRLMLRCVAEIRDLYQEAAERRLENLKNPVSQKVMFPISSTSPHHWRFSVELLMSLIVLSYVVHRIR